MCFQHCNLVNELVRAFTCKLLDFTIDTRKAETKHMQIYKQEQNTDQLTKITKQLRTLK